MCLHSLLLTSPLLLGHVDLEEGKVIYDCFGPNWTGIGYLKSE